MLKKNLFLLKHFKNYSVFFARKFDPIFNQRIINHLDNGVNDFNKDGRK